jgi:hypothetical protein
MAELSRAPGWTARDLIDYTRERLPFSGGWFRVELSFSAGPTITARLFDSTGTSEVAALSARVPDFAPGPLVLSAGWTCVDTVTISGP